MSGIFGGLTVPLRRDVCDLQSSTPDLRHFERHAVVDHFSMDLDRGMVLLGPSARKFHGIAAGSGMIGIRRFLDCYHASERNGLLCLLERLASQGNPVHYTARLVDAGGPFVHGFITRAEAGDESGRWSGFMVMPRSGLREPSSFGEAGTA